jgi:hypothetical protein
MRAFFRSHDHEQFLFRGYIAWRELYKIGVDKTFSANKIYFLSTKGKKATKLLAVCEERTCSLLSRKRKVL